MNFDDWRWRRILSGKLKLNTTGFKLLGESSRSFQFPSGWSGRVWARTGCKLDRSGSWSCQTGDCGTGLVECNGALYSGPVTIAEFTLGSYDGQDFYDISVVDGFNIPMNLEAAGGFGSCGSVGCNVDLNQLCPVELTLKDGEGCMDPSLGKSEYCCIGPYNSRGKCGPNVYSEMFKAACPRSITYTYDDLEPVFDCKGSDFVVTFCPSSSFSSS